MVEIILFPLLQLIRNFIACPSYREFIENEREPILVESIPMAIENRNVNRQYSGVVVAMIVWQLELQLPMQSVLITIDVVSSNLDQGEVYNIIRSSLSVTCNKWVFFSGSSGFPSNKTDRHDIAEILLKVALNTIKQTNS